MSLRFDPSIVLNMYNQARQTSEELAQRERMAAINQALEEQKATDERNYRTSEIAIQNRAADEARLRGDQAAAWHEAEIQRQIKNDQMQSDWHNQEVQQKIESDKTMRGYYQGMLGYYNRMASIAENKQLDANGKPLTASQQAAQARADYNSKRAALQTDLNTAMKGFNFDTNPSASFAKGGKATADEMQTSMNAYNNVLGVLQKYDEGGFPATALNQNLIAKIRNRLGQSTDWLKTIQEMHVDPNQSPDPNNTLSMEYRSPIERTPVVPQEQKNALWNQWNDINARLSQFDNSGLSQAGLIPDPATGKLYQYKP